jgi:hypothetical protein
MIQDISQTALALAVLSLGVVVAFELRSLGRLRRTLNLDLQRLFEQLDLVRFDGQQLAEAQQQSARAPQRTAVALPVVQGSVAADYAAVSQLAVRPPATADVARRTRLAAGEERVLVALQKLRNERGSTH